MTRDVPPARLLFSAAEARKRIRIDVRGVVQGVGFRPFIYRWARRLDLNGWVENTAAGVSMEVEGNPDDIATLLRKIKDAPPPNASVSHVDVHELQLRGDDTFSITASAPHGARGAQILPDLATCAECLQELFDPTDRRYLYPFINCTHCGPRFSIIEDVPYDRVRTSMRHFPMCPACQAEYDDPLNRRFHAEPNACANCGPHIVLCDAENTVLANDHDALLAAVAAIQQGRIVAVKGIGGFHLIVDARNEIAVALLRARKRRPDKPFAVMFPSLAAVEGECMISPEEITLLVGPARPIVLVRRKNGSIAAAVAPRNPWLGALLPYAPLHYLLMNELDFPVVATSGNLSDEPIATDEADARSRLCDVADLFLVHDRPIVRPVDDSVARVVGGRELILRRARGYAPGLIAEGIFASGIIALGGHLKNTLAMTREDSIILSQHLGDMEYLEGRAVHTRAVRDLSKLYGSRPRLVVRDLHPDYATSRMADEMGIPVASVQHHLAHVVACMTEHKIVPPVLGVAWDGTGFGPDGTIWGGEFLLIAEDGWRRIGHLRTFRLPGGEFAVREPRRAALGLLYEVFGKDAFTMVDLPPIAAFSGAKREVMQNVLARGVNAPRTSSMGRLFDGFAALCGLRQHTSYEGQAAMEFEWAMDGMPTHTPYEFPLRVASFGDAPWIMDWQPALQTVITERQAGIAAGTISAAFHAGLAVAIAKAADLAGEHRVILTGGCFQNVHLSEAAISALQDAGHEPIWHQHVPPNDGGIALGQAMWASWSERRGGLPCA